MFDALQELAEQLIKLTPDNLFAWENYMHSLRALGKFEEANDALDRVIDLEPDNVRFWTLKADTLYRLERYREAASVAERARHIDSEYPPAHRIHEKALRSMYQRKDKKKGKTPL
jgi:tetratricopeptide (TPR) repeat protein